MALVPCGISPEKLADETRMGGLSSLINSAPPASPPLISKPPKKRYLENCSFKPAVAPVVSVGGQGQGQSDKQLGDPRMDSACSALLELAEMCSSELHCDASSSKPTNNNNVIRPKSIINGKTTMESVASNSIMPDSSSSSSTTSSSTTTSSRASEILPLAPHVPLATQTLGKAASILPPISENLREWMVGKLAGHMEAPRPPPKMQLDDQPLDLCKEKTFTTSHQRIINCIVDRLCSAPESTTVTSRTILSPSQPLSQRIQSLMDTAKKDELAVTTTPVLPKKGEPVARGSTSSPSYLNVQNVLVQKDKESPGKKVWPEEDDDMDNYEDEDNEEDCDSVTSSSATSRRSGKMTGNKGSRNSEGGRAGSKATSDADSFQPRQPQRSCKGKRYQTFISEGLLQPAKERKWSSSTGRILSLDERPGSDAVQAEAVKVAAAIKNPYKVEKVDFLLSSSK